AQHRLAGAGRAAPLGAQPAQLPGPALLPAALERRAATEVALVPADDPTEPGVQRRDARAELVAVQRQPRLEPQGVAGTEARGGRPRRGERVPERLGDGHRDGALDAVLTGVAGAGDEALDPLVGERLQAEPGDALGPGRHLANDLARPWPLHGQQRAGGRRVLDLQLVVPGGGVEGVAHVVAVRGGGPDGAEVV